MNSEFPQWLEASRRRVNSLLERALKDLSVGVPKRLHDAMASSVLAGGKRLRPTLVLAFAELPGNGPAGAIAEDSAVAIEFIHAYSLIHDDLPAMDNAELRHGQPSCHRVYGEATAVLAGDALFSEAFHRLLGGAPSEASLRALIGRELAQAAGATGMVGGQELDMSPTGPTTIETLTHLHALKTGALIRAACRMGALASGATPSQLASATTYGEKIGLAFQIADDVLDATADAAKLGKPAQADAQRGKITFAGLLGVEAARAKAAALVIEACETVGQQSATAEALRSLAEYVVSRQH